jgi:hypothetical protein
MSNGFRRPSQASEFAPSPSMSAPPTRVNGFADHEDMEDGVESGTVDDSLEVSRHERHGFAEEYQSEAYMRELESKRLSSSSNHSIVLISAFQVSGSCIGPMSVLSLFAARYTF